MTFKEKKLYIEVIEQLTDHLEDWDRDYEYELIEKSRNFIRKNK